MGSIRRKLCPSQKEVMKNKKLYCKENNIEINTTVTKKKGKKSLVNYLTDEDVKGINLYVQSLLGISHLNIDAIDEIKLWFSSTHRNEFYFLTGYNVEIVEFTLEQKDALLEAYRNVFTHLLGKKVVEVEREEDANIIVGNTSDYLPYCYVTSIPTDLDLFRELLQEKSYVLFSAMDDTDNVSFGSKWFMLFLASALKVLGFKNTNESDMITHPMPAVVSSNGITGAGMFTMNSSWVTLLTDEVRLDLLNSPADINWEDTSYPCTPMPLDYLALQYIYDLVEPKKVNIDYQWEDLHTVYAPNGAILNLKPQSDKDKIFNLTLDQLPCNPTVDRVNAFSCISRSLMDKRGLILERDSFYSEVNCCYETLNLFATQFRASTLINVTDDCKIINLYVSGKEEDYELNEQDNILLKNKKKNRAIVITCLDSTTVNVYFCGEKYKGSLDGEPSVKLNNVTEEKEEEEEFYVNEKKLQEYIAKKKENVQGVEQEIKEEETAEEEINEEVPQAEQAEAEAEQTMVESANPSVLEAEQTLVDNEEDVDEDGESDTSSVCSVKSKKHVNPVIANLKDEHYAEIVKAFKKEFAGYKRWDDKRLTKELNEFATDFITRKFRNRIEGADFKLKGRL